MTSFHEIETSKNFPAFFEWAEKYLEKHGKTLTVHNGRNVKFDSGLCVGWCDGEEISIALKNPKAEEVFVHEFSHMMQAIEGSPLWKDGYSFWTSLKKGKLEIQDWPKLMEVIALEHDCETRALKLSKKWNLFNNKKYAQAANSYLYYYQYVFLRKKWFNSTCIYKPNVLDFMPNTLNPLESFNYIDMRMMDAFDEVLNKKRK